MLNFAGATFCIRIYLYWEAKDGTRAVLISAQLLLRFYPWQIWCDLIRGRCGCLPQLLVSRKIRKIDKEMLSL